MGNTPPEASREYRYDAFISYRHIAPDKDIARLIQKKLESYRPPRQIASNGSNRLRIFRDETEFSTSSDLAGNIRSALESSRYLIVICSEEYKKSPWCLEELHHFKALHGGKTDRIITVIAKGEAPSVFPEELASESIEVTDGDGKTTLQSRRIEPLAANLSAKTPRESAKLLKTELLRIAAPLLDCRYDDLYNRHLRRRTRNIAAIVMSVMIFSAAFGLYSGAMLYRIGQQNDELGRVNDELRESERLALIESAKSSALLSDTLYKNGDTLSAIESALSALPKDRDDTVLPMAERILAKELNAFERSDFRQVLKLTQPGEIKSVSFVGAGETMIVEAGECYRFIDPASGEVLRELSNSGVRLLGHGKPLTLTHSSLENSTGSTLMWSEDGIYGYRKSDTDEAAIRVDTLISVSAHEIALISAKNGDTLRKITTDDNVNISVPTATLLDDRLICHVTDYSDNSRKVVVYERETLEVIASYTSPDYNLSMLFNSRWLAFGEKSAILCTQATGYINVELICFTIESGELRSPVKLSTEHKLESGVYSGLLAETSSDGVLYLLMSRYKPPFYGAAVLSAYDIDSGELIWESAFDDANTYAYAAMGRLNAADTGGAYDLLYLLFDRELTLFKASDGERLCTYEFRSSAVSHYTSTDGMFFVLDDYGRETLITFRRHSDSSIRSTDYRYVTKSFDPPFANCVYGDRRYVSWNDGSFELFIYATVENEDFTVWYKNGKDSSNGSISFSPDSESALICAYPESGTQGNNLFLIDTQSGDSRELLRSESYITACGFVGNSRIFAVKDSTLFLYDAESGAELKSIPSTSGYTTVKYSPSGEKVAIKDGMRIVILTGSDATAWDFSDYVGWFDFIDENKLAVLTSASRGAKLMLLDTKSGTILHARFAEPLDFTSTDTPIIGSIASKYDISLFFDDGRIRRFSLIDGAELTPAAIEIQAPLVAVSKAGKDAVALSSDGKLHLIDLRSAQIKSTLDCALGYTPSATLARLEYFDRCGLLTVSSSTGGEARIVDVDDFSVRCELSYFRDFDPNFSRIAVNEYNIAGCVPCYTTAELIAKGEKALGIE